MYFFYFIFKLYNIVLVLPYIKMNLPQVYMCSPFWTLLPLPSPYHPSGSSQCTSPKHPVSCIEPGLVTCFIHDIIHVSMPFSQISPPSPSPAESIRLNIIKSSLFQPDTSPRKQNCLKICTFMRQRHMPLQIYDQNTDLSLPHLFLSLWLTGSIWKSALSMFSISVTSFCVV